jgi:hypothetical protein
MTSLAVRLLDLIPKPSFASNLTIVPQQNDRLQRSASRVENARDDDDELELAQPALRIRPD